MLNGSVSLKQLWRIFVVNILVIAIGALVFGAGGYFYARHKTSTTYTANCSLILTPTALAGGRTFDQVQANIALANTYANVVTDPVITDRVNAQLKHRSDYTYDQESLPDQIKVTTRPGAAWLRISGSAKSKKLAIAITDTTAKVTRKNLAHDSGLGTRVRLLATAKRNGVSSETTPSVKKVTIFAAAVGIIITGLMVFTWDIFRGGHRDA
ncbi:Wzz/FepE/Etk N-terminal domain-containing protein [Furfurilactobacillus curtus]|uniref:Polysaccharide chain length determinant N-terminal domain-containing protein n=1 Tax=Furfurilactobacillus curtus TaxID=1746200 RepID=A0ABQ5JPD0_9LACO